MVDISLIISGFWSSLDLHLVGMNDRGGLILTIWAFVCDSFPDAQIVYCHDQQLTFSLSIGSWVHRYTFVFTITSAMEVALAVSSGYDFEVSSHKPFRFQSIWLEHPNFIAIVCGIWSSAFKEEVLWGNLAMKIDICKAFGTLGWSFLCKLLQVFGFSSVFMDWIDGILPSSRLSVLLNGVLESYFFCSKEVHLGDPFSPLLFVSLLRGKPRKAVLQLIAEKILSKFAKWKGKYLSLADRATLIRSVITEVSQAVAEASGKEGGYVLDDCFRVGFPDLCFRIDRIAISPVVDSLVWTDSRDGRVSCKAAFSQFFRDIPQVFHIFREENRVADAISKHALELQADSWWFSASPFCSSLVGNDYKNPAKHNTKKSCGV
ncbi:hypothetical protein Dsin_012723 [Dipteronia sinensis]|uniref:Uncharacterized protein n=1 Tax=Dipteronia sinensis TaxID=43782 RepID=A0AAE0E876_9ROSI|nr:hypothetical protein Dsin_012723 [Dipteronia sinensis]